MKKTVKNTIIHGLSQVERKRTDLNIDTVTRPMYMCVYKNNKGKTTIIR